MSSTQIYFMVALSKIGKSYSDWLKRSRVKLFRRKTTACMDVRSLMRATKSELYILIRLRIIEQFHAINLVLN